MIATAPQDTWHIGADLLRLRESGLTSPFLFDVYGVVTPDIPSRWSPEKRAYYLIAMDVFVAIKQGGRRRSRSSTHFRVAAAIIAELCLQPACPNCNGSGMAATGRGRPTNDGLCSHCHGTGVRMLSRWKRADACDCHRSYFSEWLSKIYHQKLVSLARSMRVG